MLKLWSAQGFITSTLSAYIKALADTLPESLSVVYLVNSGSEANDLALRLARQYTKREDIAVFEAGYHGNLSSLVDVSQKTFRTLPQGKKKFVHVIPLPKPDPSYGPNTDQGHIHVQKAKAALASSLGEGKQMSCLISEMLPLVSGIVVPPKSYFQQLYQLIRDKGGICIADEVQTGLGRTGENYWAFQSYGVVPDIVTVGKPLGNGFPIGAVITSRTIADSLGEYLTSFGGNPVACSIGLAVLEVIKNEKLMSSTRCVGRYLLQGLTGLMERHPTIGDVRGMGLYIGVEMVLGRPNFKPATQFTERLAYKLKDKRILVGIESPDKNVVVLTPPLCFTLDNARHLIETFDLVLTQLEKSGDEDLTPEPSLPLPIGLIGLTNDEDEDEDQSPTKRRRLYEEMD